MEYESRTSERPLWDAISVGRRNTSIKSFCRRFKIWRFSWSFNCSEKAGINELYVIKMVSDLNDACLVVALEFLGTSLKILTKMYFFASIGMRSGH